MLFATGAPAALVLVFPDLYKIRSLGCMIVSDPPDRVFDLRPSLSSIPQRPVHQSSNEHILGAICDQAAHLALEPQLEHTLDMVHRVDVITRGVIRLGPAMDEGGNALLHSLLLGSHVGTIHGTGTDGREHRVASLGGAEAVIVW